MMKKVLSLIFLMMFCWTGLAVATVLTLNVDSAPNKHGSPDWAQWWTDTKTDVPTGTFKDMRTGVYPGTHTIDPYDEIVYDNDDFGKRLHWIYWLTDLNKVVTTDFLGRFEVKWVIDWNGSNWTAAADGSWLLDGPDAGWKEPTTWENYNDGVIGSLGFALWMEDANQAKIDALRASTFSSQTFATGMVRYREDVVGSAWQVTELRVNIVPEPTTIVLFSFGILGLAGVSRKKHSRLVDD
jgi:hypothetical protein